MTQAKEDARHRSALLKELRDQHADTVERIRVLLKEQKAIRRLICQQLRTGPKIVPEISQATELPANEVLWHITAMKKYDLIAEVGQCGEYYQYAMSKEDVS
jgi:hypothetical protein